MLLRATKEEHQAGLPAASAPSRLLKSLAERTRLRHPPPVALLKSAPGRVLSSPHTQRKRFPRTITNTRTTTELRYPGPRPLPRSPDTTTSPPCPPPPPSSSCLGESRRAGRPAARHGAGGLMGQSPVASSSRGAPASQPMVSPGPPFGASPAISRLAPGCILGMPSCRRQPGLACAHCWGRWLGGGPTNLAHPSFRHPAAAHSPQQ